MGKTLLLMLAVGGAVLAAPSAAQPTGEAARVAEELQALHVELNRARRAHDMEALRRIYAPEFRWVHGFGYADDRERQIQNIIEADSDRDLPAIDFSPPTELMVFGDTAVIRHPDRAVSGMRLYSVQIFVRREGRWQILHIQGTPLQPERSWIELAPAALDAFAGRYRNPASGTEAVVTREGGALHMRIPEVPIRVLRPVAPDRFFDRIGTEYQFRRDSGGRVTSFTFRMMGGREGTVERIAD